MAKQHTVDVIKELGTLQPPELVDVKQELSPDSEVPPELSVAGVTESSNTVDVMKELGTLQPPELVDVKQEISPDSEVPPELSVGEVTESSKTNETPLKPCVDVIMQHMKTLVEQLEKSQGEIEKRLKSVEEQLGKDQGVIENHLKSVKEQLGKDQGVIEKHLKSVEKRLEEVESSLSKRSQGVQPNMSVNEKDASGNTQLMCAASKNDIIKTTMLLKMGADVNIANNDGWLPLHEAAVWGRTELCALFLLVGNADINAKTKNYNKTSLHYAALNGQIKVVELLIKFGADVNLKCSKGKTAYDYAVENKNNEIALLLDCVINRDMYASLLNQPLKK